MSKKKEDGRKRREREREKEDGERREIERKGSEAKGRFNNQDGWRKGEKGRVCERERKKGREWTLERESECEETRKENKSIIEYSNSERTKAKEEQEQPTTATVINSNREQEFRSIEKRTEQFPFVPLDPRPNPWFTPIPLESPLTYPNAPSPSIFTHYSLTIFYTYLLYLPTQPYL